MKIRHFVLMLLSFLLGSCFNFHPKLKNTDDILMVKHLNKSSIMMLSLDEDGEYSPMCSGVWISQTKILSARHCVEPNIKPTSVLSQYGIDIQNQLSSLPGMVIPYANYDEKSKDFSIKNKPHFAVVIAYTETSDLVLLSTITDNKDHDYTSIADDDPSPGEKLHIIGHTIGMKYNYNIGYMSRESIGRRLDGDFPVFQISTIIGPGNSGGGAFNADGQLIGICSMYNPRFPGYGYFVDLTTIKDFISQNKYS